MQKIFCKICEAVFFIEEEDNTATKIKCPACGFVNNISDIEKKNIVNTIKKFVSYGNTKEALDYLIERSEVFTEKFSTDIILIRCRYMGLIEDFIVRGIMERNDYNLGIMQINNALLTLVSQTNNNQTNNVKTGKLKYKGRLLHDVPSKMILEEECKIIVRVAFTDNFLLKDLDESKTYSIQDIKVSELMSVQLVDFNDNSVFHIRSITDEKQAIFTDDYTQWLFKVKPLKKGSHSLTLKVSTVVNINGERVNHNIVLEKMVNIVIHTQEIKENLNKRKLIFEKGVIELFTGFIRKYEKGNDIVIDDNHFELEEGNDDIWLEEDSDDDDFDDFRLEDDSDDIWLDNGDDDSTPKQPKTPTVRNKSSKEKNENSSNVSKIGSLAIYEKNSIIDIFNLIEGINIIGRKTSKTQSKVNITIDNKDSFISREHCILEVRKQNNTDTFLYILSDISINGTYVNRRKVINSEQLFLKDGDIIQIGETLLLLVLETKKQDVENIIVTKN
jgi:phage FluMu protein Com